MGLREWLGRRFSRTPAEATAASVPAPAAPPADPLAPLRGVRPAEGIDRAIALLDAQPDGAAAALVLAWLRAASTEPLLASEARLRVADFFLARGEPDAAQPALEWLANGGDGAALAALTRLADIAQEHGDRDAVARAFEEILALDVAHPGVRERLSRMRAPARAGGAGATLLSPEAARMAHGRVSLVRELGRGGAGAVFLARDALLLREVALKIYHPAQRADRGTRLRAEARIAASLASRHVVRVFELFEDLGGLAMEFCPGGALRGAVQRGGHSVSVRRAWLRGVAHALAVTHDRGWVHRDLKPGNVLLRADGTTVLTDFGLARRAGATIEPHEGTAGFVAPEVRARLVADPRLDVFAFGALAREVSGDDPALAELIARTLAPEPEARPRDGAALLAPLDALH